MSNKKTYVMIIWVLLILLLCVGGYLIYSYLNQDNRYKGKSGSVDGQATEWEDGLSAPSEIKGQILVPGYSGATMKAGDKTLALHIGNPAENTCYLQATLQLVDGTVLFESGLIEPGKGYQQIELTKTLEAGSYEAFVHYQGYSMEEEPEVLNSCDSAFTLTVTE